MKTIISAIGCVCALGNDIGQISKNLFAGNSLFSYPAARLQSSYSNEYPVFTVAQEILSQKKDGESYSYLFLRKALEEALESAVLKSEDLKKARVGVCIGATVDISFNCFDFYKEWRKSRSSEPENPASSPKKPAKPAALDKYIGYSAASEILKDLGIDGISQTVVSACACGTDAAGIGAQWIEHDICDIVICGATDELNMIPYTGFIKLMIASKERCRPFDKNRNGINLGEGAGVLILESQKNYEHRLANLKSAQKKLPDIKGFILGYGTAVDAYHATAPDPQGRGLKKAVEFAFSQADKSKENIAFINAHATGTKDNDAAEAAVFNSLLKGVPVSATKSLTGHALGAAGAVEACLTLICLNEGRIPPVKNFTVPDESLNFCPALKETFIDGAQAALSVSLAFGGCNAALILGGKKYGGKTAL
ncbi:MAG: beta-ketoacyl-[acyl-carrier-protein] synthase family protein [Endomicrobium sp.]|jgi:3-oxoacyl-(acyl-carrier-protein) synthase|nr:beta-ketoacyl-[acyl-carrier-protein] synthase family protein [Endomicrobium sp.]